MEKNKSTGETKLEKAMLSQVVGDLETLTLVVPSSSSGTRSSTFKPPKNWANAPVFIPRTTQGISTGQSPESAAHKLQEMVAKSQETPAQKFQEMVVLKSKEEGSTSSDLTPMTYAQAAKPGLADLPEGSWSNPNAALCPFAMIDECRYGNKCALLHGLPCEFCGRAVLHPHDPAQREKHVKECVQQHERDMELSFAIARSSEMRCGICMDLVMEKTPPGEQRFGILPTCNHCYCLECIRRWRRSKQFEKAITRGCPECRMVSDFVCPSRFWFDKKEEKDKLISSYKVALSKKPCRYYKGGSGTCPFGNKCFYLHALPNGVVVDVGPPPCTTRRRRRNGASGSSVDHREVSIFDFLEEFEMDWMDIDDFIEMFDSDNQSILSSDSSEL